MCVYIYIYIYIYIHIYIYIYISLPHEPTEENVPLGYRRKESESYQVSLGTHLSGLPCIYLSIINIYSCTYVYFCNCRTSRRGRTYLSGTGGRNPRAIRFVIGNLSVSIYKYLPFSPSIYLSI